MNCLRLIAHCRAPCAGSHEWGDDITLVAAALLFRVRIHVLVAGLDAGVFTYDVGSLRRALLDVLERPDLRPLGSRLGRQWRRGEVYMETSLCVCALCLSRLSVHESIRHHKIAIRLRLLMIYTPK